MAEFFNSLANKYPRAKLLFAKVLQNNQGKFQDEDTRFDELTFAAIAEVLEGVQEFADKIVPNISKIDGIVNEIDNIKSNDDLTEFKHELGGQLELIHDIINNHANSLQFHTHDHGDIRGLGLMMQNISEIQDALEDVSLHGHEHNINDIPNLQLELNRRALTSHEHSDYLTRSIANSMFAFVDHGHHDYMTLLSAATMFASNTEISNLQTQINNRALTNHTHDFEHEHNINDIPNLQPILDKLSEDAAQDRLQFQTNILDVEINMMQSLGN
jgi:DNA-directed RNA polymerase subunit K/omega